MQHDGSAFQSTKRAIEAAEARGYEPGLADRARLDSNSSTAWATAHQQTTYGRLGLSIEMQGTWWI